MLSLDFLFKKIESEGITSSNGICVDKNITVTENGDYIYRYVINGILIFMATYGSLTCFISAFSIEFYNVMLFFILLVISLLYAFMHVSKKIRKIGYGVVFITYIYLIVRLHIVIKSGFAKIVNVYMDYIETYFVLPMTKRYSEYVEDSKMAVTVCLILVGFVMALLLNIIVSEFMSIIGLIIVTLPIAQLGMYFDLEVNYLSALMLFTSYVGVLVIKMSRRYCITENEVVYSTNTKGKQNYIRYGTDPKVMTQFAGIAIIIVILEILIVSPFVYVSNYGHNLKVKAIKKSTNIYARDFAITGISALLFGNSYGAGGISGGQKLGQASVIWRDYKTDLEVTFVPLNTERQYLRAYVGSSYSDSQWKRLSSNQENDYYDILSMYEKYNFTSNILKADFDNGIGLQNYKGKMVIANVGADKQYVYSPYYTLSDIEYSSIFNDDTAYMHSDLSSYNIEYYPYTNETYQNFLNSRYYAKLMENDSDYDYNKELDLYTYSWFVNSSYMQVPSENAKVIKKICDKYNLDPINIEETNIETYNENVQNIIDKVTTMLDDNYQYSLKCGKTPDETDFVNYFLDGNKSGYCAHFASSATLIFRYLGIPARYVEGYVIDRDNIVNGDVIDQPVENYLKTNNNAIDDSKLKVVKTYINDSQAHAWVEVYFENFGWVPVEVTPASDDSDGDKGFESNGFLDSIISLFTSGDSNEIQSSSSSVKTTASDFYSIGKKILKGIAIVILLIIVAWCVKLLVVYYNRRNKFTKNNFSSRIYALYGYLLMILKFSYCKKECGMTISEYFNIAANKLSIENEILQKIYDYYTILEFSEHEISEEQYEFVKENVLIIKDSIYSNLKWSKKIMFRFVYNL